MELKELYEKWGKHPQINPVVDSLGKGESIKLCGLSGSSRSMLVGQLRERINRPIIYIAKDKDEAGYAYNDLTQILGDEGIFFFPSSYKNGLKSQKTDGISEVLRTQTLNELSSAEGNPIVLTYAEAVAEKVVERKSLRSKIITLKVGQEISLDGLTDLLLDNHFVRVDFVYEPGQFSVRGGILDVFSYSNELPFRIDFFGDEIDSIRLFNIETQLSEENRKSVVIAPELNVSDGREITKKVGFLDFIEKKCLLVTDSFETLSKQIGKCGFVNSGDEVEKGNTDTVVWETEWRKSAEGFQKMEMTSGETQNGNVIRFDIKPQMPFHKNFDLVADYLKKYSQEGYEVWILSDSVKQTDRIKAIFEDKEETDVRFTPVLKTIHEGFTDHDMRMCLLTDHEIFDRFHKYSLRSDKARNGKVLLTLKELGEMKIGDYVTHVDHGVGKFGGLLKMDVNGQKQEVIKLLYQNNDTIYVSIHNLHRISKYKGKDGEAPKVNKLGSGVWERLKEKTKKKVKDIARDLIRLYAKRKSEQGFAYSPDSYLQKELEASFVYEDTPDQQKATQDVKRDMERKLPMDRLVCGDVGFGKTEVAMRAAFKAVGDNKQVAVLVPTTVLALQHYKSFCERLKNFPCTIEYLSRAKSAAQTKDILERLKAGKIDVIIGTHKLVGKNVQFKDLGLLIIDEEQKFGVSVKEQLKKMKVNVDTLTMTATPIPRTLQFSLLGARDLSIINTPPPNRFPVQTELCEMNEATIKEAIEREMERNGQVFVINNRIHNIYELERIVRKAVPQARIVVGHGQMEAEKLEKIITDFIDYEYDVLIATTIIESGIDIPNANTIIINDAHMFGLSDLHQLRGRVGRSNRKAYCYLMTPPLDMLTNDARRRLEAIETFSELGSGFQLAMQDLDIRGAGNMLGSEQSGFIADLGYETYQKILEEAMHELREEEFSELYQDQITEENQSRSWVTDCQLETDLSILIPSEYIESVSERMSIYRQIDGFTEERQIEELKKELNDRFGEIPDELEVLFDSLRLRWKAMEAGVERLVLKNGRMICYLVSNTESVYYKSEVFGGVLSFVASNPLRCKLKEGEDKKRSVTVKDVRTVTEALKIIGNWLK